jgi:hypothetical protein
VLLPFSLPGLLFVIGALGFTPFLTAWAFLQVGKQCLPAIDGARDTDRMISGLALVLIGVVVFQIGMSRLIEYTATNVSQGDYSVTWLQVLEPFGMGARIHQSWVWASAEQKEHLATAYQAAFGGQIERSTWALRD